MKFNKFMSVAAFSIIALSITACSKEPGSAFKENADLGYYEGMHITWVKDDADTKGTGFYLIDNTHIDTKQPNNADFAEEKIIGHYGDLKIYWVQDHTEADSKGFYLFKTSDNQIVPTLTAGEKFSNGKSQTTKDVGVVFTSAINSPTLKIKLDDKPYEENVKVSELSSAELIALSQRLLDVAQQRQLEDKNNSTNSNGTGSVKPKL